MLEDDVIECSLHFGAFDVPTGEVKAPPCSIALRTYKVVLQGDDILRRSRQGCGRRAGLMQRRRRSVSALPASAWRAP